MYANWFRLGDDIWTIEFVSPQSPMLMDRTGVSTVATTDPYYKRVYLSRELSGDFLNRVLIHELGHCAMVSFNLLPDIHSAVRPEHWVIAEEWLCNFIADFGINIYKAAYEILGPNAWLVVQEALNRVIA